MDPDLCLHKDWFTWDVSWKGRLELEENEAYLSQIGLKRYLLSVIQRIFYRVQVLTYFLGHNYLYGFTAFSMCIIILRTHLVWLKSLENTVNVEQVIRKRKKSLHIRRSLWWKINSMISWAFILEFSTPLKSVQQNIHFGKYSDKYCLFDFHFISASAISHAELHSEQKGPSKKHAAKQNNIFIVTV